MKVVVSLLLFLLSTNSYTYPHKPVIKAYADAHNIDPKLVAAVIKVESSFNPKARNKSGAVGLMQVMPATHRYICNKNSWKQGDLTNVSVNVRTGVAYLAELIKIYGAEDLALEAYFGGSKRTQYTLRYARKVQEAKNKL